MANCVCDSIECRYKDFCGAYNSTNNMTEYDILKQEGTMCEQIWNSKPCKLNENGVPERGLTHYHMCDFEILSFKHCKNRRQLEKTVEKKCKEYLVSIGKERDEYMCCCDTCIHDRYLTVSEETEDLILNIATLGLDVKMKELDGDIDAKGLDC